MGCDIHLFVEYKRYNTYWNFGNEFHLTRDYLMFGMMSKGVRTTPDFSYEQRGLPEDISNTAKSENRLFISEKTTDSGYCTLEDAKRYERHGSEIIYQNNEPTWVTHPDWHSHSWLKPHEYKKILSEYSFETDHRTKPDVEYLVIESILETLQKVNKEPRLVFWFDN